MHVSSSSYDDRAWYVFAIVAVYTIVTYSMGLPFYYLITLNRRRHRLDEAKET